LIFPSSVTAIPANFLTNTFQHPVIDKMLSADEASAIAQEIADQCTISSELTASRPSTKRALIVSVLMVIVCVLRGLVRMADGDKAVPDAQPPTTIDAPAKNLPFFDYEMRYVVCIVLILSLDFYFVQSNLNYAFSFAIVALQFLLLKILANRWDIKIAHSMIDEAASRVFAKGGKRK
jgi:hypothetical protein